MTFKILDCDQGSLEWFNLRLGKPTASIFSKITTPTGKLSTSSEEIINRAVAELLVGTPDDTFTSNAMNRGNELESEAFDYFNYVYDMDFETCGFASAINEDESELGFGCSPDGIDLNKKVGLEMKCPLLHNHLAYLSDGKLPKQYIMQVQGSMMVTGFKSWWFGSYHPGIKDLFIEVKRDEELIKKLREHVLYCVREINIRHEKLVNIGI
jgi:hypothetical protein